MRKKVSKEEKMIKEKNRQMSQQKKNQRNWGIAIAVISVILVLAMLLTSVRF